ncbi:putative short-chain dehydrogenase [Aspergillus granulosus]|uniref:Short-chain dehydrogenase n=1 Tax=Aspergillus granulosus TaxID=176169 RepID=A0ABR4GYR9_9EURO
MTNILADSVTSKIQAPSAFIPPTPKETDLSVYTVVITGASAGLGKEASFQLLRLGIKTLIIGVRNLAKGYDVRSSLLADPEISHRNPTAVIKVLPLDLEDYSSVICFADKVRQETEELDVLILNAGINLGHFEKCRATGHERFLQVNYLSNALLALLLLPTLKQTKPKQNHHPTIAWVGSIALSLNSVTKSPVPKGRSILTTYDDPTHFSRLFRYSDTKFFVALFIRQLAELWPLHAGPCDNGNVVINNVCPGTVVTTADNHLPFYLRIPMNVHRLIRGRSVLEGGRTFVYAATVAGVESHGGFISCNEITPLPPNVATAEGKAFAQQLWDESIEELTKVDSRVLEALKP